MHKTTTLAALGLFATTTLALAGGSHGGGHGPDIGSAGDPAEVDREIAVSMDEMDYAPESIEVKSGETVRFVVTNDGRMVHEFNIGTDAMWDAHRDEMQEMMQAGVMTARDLRHEKMEEMGMMHDDANSVLLGPGESAEIVWTFPDGGTVGFACNVPGHREAGMVGEFDLMDEENDVQS